MVKKHLYRIQEVADLLGIPTSTLRWWESVFPMFNPTRLKSGQRRFTDSDIKLAKKIKELLYDKGLKTDAAINVLNKTFCLNPPRRLRKCDGPRDAIVLLDEVSEVVEDVHALAKIEAVENWIEKQTDSQT